MKLLGLWPEFAILYLMPHVSCLSIHQQLLNSSHLLIKLATIFLFLLHHLIYVRYTITWVSLLYSINLLTTFLERIIIRKFFSEVEQTVVSLELDGACFLPMWFSLLLIVFKTVTILSRNNYYSPFWFRATCWRTYVLP